MTDVMIDARDLTKHYGPVTALKNATFQVNRGEVVGFLGPNGAGKTTTMKILTCFIAPSGGTARLSTLWWLTKTWTCSIRQPWSGRLPQDSRLTGTY